MGHNDRMGKVSGMNLDYFGFVQRPPPVIKSGHSGSEVNGSSDGDTGHTTGCRRWWCALTTVAKQALRLEWVF